MYTHMMIHHTNMSDVERTNILNLIERIGWPLKVQAMEEIRSGSRNGLDLAWSAADNIVLKALRGKSKLTWKEIADTFFVDRLEEELEKQYTVLQAGRDREHAVVLE